ncbi:TIGR02646 family protein [Leucothrix sargassi]|nr:TIGR02646 family protein [Leucothrix sargassi]
MKRIVRGQEPQGLLQFRQRNPDKTWKQFKQFNKATLRELQTAIRSQQGGLCAYCEIDFCPPRSSGAPDSRIEHFHPKSDKKGGHNWHLDWSNLYGCCHGGTRPNVADAKSRYTSPDHSCDVPKGDQNLDGLILDPVTIPAYPPLFDVARNGIISVNERNCYHADIEANLATGSITHLRLNAERLKRLRRAELNAINQMLGDLVAQGMSVKAAREKLAKGLLRKDKQGRWPKFFSSIRSYLGKAAERQLKAIGYSG